MNLKVILSFVSCVAESVRSIPVSGGMNGGGLGGTVSTSLSGQQLASAIPSPTSSSSSSKSWRSKSMNLKHSATSSMLASPTHSPHSPPQGPDAGLQLGAPPQRSMLDKFRLINPRSGSRVSPSVEMALQEEDDLSEYGEDGLAPPGSVSTFRVLPRKRTDHVIRDDECGVG